ncbi:hypothetical protein DIURU_000915 [Diutina rugosa]|uniref:Major facilitator superfamily (MFS) profile domain-containing protein n=1 Tax=Diutina rugosa TaxID=5481 RepID=A0A642V2T0_DIURU|nr:uncharacterized protein DIURU_000915 [Diutina rugosa]KAA8906754.1 hypothetical protein DIURU_000915 [Diutina rugosa]
MNSVELETITPAYPSVLSKRHDVDTTNAFAPPPSSFENGSDEASVPVQQGVPPMTLHDPPRNMWRTVACILWGFSLGFSDAAPGALLPHIETYYNINYAVVSMIWVANAVGFIVVALLAHTIEPLLGRQKSLLLSCVLNIVMYALVSSGTAFPVIAVGFFFGGLGAGLGVAQTNVFLSRMELKARLLSFIHGAYGLGATISPIIATSVVNANVAWHYFYLILLGLYAVNGINLYLSFQGSDVDLKPWDEDPTSANRIETTTHETSSVSLLKTALKNPITWLLSFFIFFYQGSEVAMAGWIVTFLLDYRHGDPSTMGYVASGFWGGLTIGRLALTNLLPKLFGIRRGVLLVSLLSILFVVLCWVIPSVVAVAVLVCLAGVFVGPNYPLMVAFTTTEGLVPRKTQVITITIMTAFGSSGGALFPFIVGLISQSAGTYVIMPVFISLYGAMVMLWLMLPNVERTAKHGTPQSLWQRLW